MHVNDDPNRSATKDILNEGEIFPRATFKLPSDKVTTSLVSMDVCVQHHNVL